jgi:hypothetical protein
MSLSRSFLLTPQGEILLYETRIDYLNYLQQYHESNISTSETKISALTIKLNSIPQLIAHGKLTPNHEDAESLRSAICQEESYLGRLKANQNLLQPIFEKQVGKLMAAKGGVGQLTLEGYQEMNKEWAAVTKEVERLAGLPSEEDGAVEMADQKESKSMKKMGGRITLPFLGGKRPKAT